MQPRWKLAVAAFCMGLVAALGQAPLGLWPLTLAALWGLFGLIARQPSAARAAWVGWIGGAGYFITALNWIVSPFFVDAARDGWMAPFAALIMGFGLALFWAGAAALGRRSWGLVITLTAAELARGYVLTGFPWALIGHIWIDTPVAQLAAWVGPFGLTLLTLAMIAPRWPVAVAMLAAAWGFGTWQLSRPMPADTAITLRLVQPNAEQALKWDAAQARVFFDRLTAMTAVRPAPNLVIWPETALPYMLEYQPELAMVISNAAAGATVALGRQSTDGTRYWNSLSILSPDGIETARYDKHHLVPFGEYIPLGDALFQWLNISAFAAQTGNSYSAGKGPVVLDLGPLGQMLPLICYEAVFPQDLRAPDPPQLGRATWILQITNDAWFGRLTGPYQHAAQARLRAIEQGLPLVRVANTGVTAVYDARGRVRAALAPDIAAYLDTTLPAPLPQTPYARWGEGPVLLVLAGLALAQWFKRRTSRA